MCNFVAIVVLANGLALICRSRIHAELAIESYDLVDIISFTTGTDVALFVTVPEVSSMAHGKDSEPLVGITGSVIYASLSLFNLT